MQKDFFAFLKIAFKSTINATIDRREGLLESQGARPNGRLNVLKRLEKFYFHLELQDK